jgi:hypothetical protein
MRGDYKSPSPHLRTGTYPVSETSCSLFRIPNDRWSPQTKWFKVLYILLYYLFIFDRLCGLVVRLPGYRPRGPGFVSRRCPISCVAVGLERGPLSPCEDKYGATWKKLAAPV